MTVSGTEIDRVAIEKFVRDELGCMCPAEVFTTIYLEKNPAEFSDLIRGALLRIGGRLLVYVVEMDDLASPASKLEQILWRGREVRNAEGFNRFRLVVVAPDVQAGRQILLQEFESLGDLDEKLHLHVIKPEQLSDFLS
jgi:hypothetical protein